MSQQPRFDRQFLIIVAGMPASGKSTLAKKISQAFSCPLLEKDNIKEELFDTIGFQCYPEKRRFDVASNAILLRCSNDILDAGSSLLIVNNFRADMKEGVEAFLNKHPIPMVMVFLTGNGDVFYERYRERDVNHRRHLGHSCPDHYPLREGEPNVFVPTREGFANVFEKLGMADFKLSCPTIEVDATYPGKIDFENLANTIEETLKKQVK